MPIGNVEDELFSCTIQLTGDSSVSEWARRGWGSRVRW